VDILTVSCGRPFHWSRVVSSRIFGCCSVSNSPAVGQYQLGVVPELILIDAHAVAGTVCRRQRMTHLHDQENVPRRLSDSESRNMEYGMDNGRGGDVSAVTLNLD